MNIVIVGYGSIGKYYLSLIKKLNFKNIYIIESKVKQKKINNNTYLYNFQDFAKKNIIVKFAIICTPSNLHFEQAQFFLNNDVNVLIEKPFVLKYKEGLKLKNLSRNKKLRCWTVFQNRLNPTIQLLKKQLSKNFFGNINFIDCKLIWSRDKKYYNNEWRGKYLTDGGVLVNQSIHLLDALVYLFGEIDTFNGNISFNKKKLEAEDYISLNFNLKRNIPVSFLATTRSIKDYEMSLDIHSSKKRLKIHGLALNSLNFYDKSLNSKFKNYSYKTNKGYGKSHKELLDNFISLNKVDKFNLSVEKNIYLIKLLNSIYYNLIDRNKLFSVNNYKSILGYGKKK